MRSALVAFAAVAAGCEPNLLLPDARADAAADAAFLCPTPAQPLAPGKYKLYLNTEGVMLLSGVPDSRTNTTDLVFRFVPPAPVIVPPFLDLVAGRQAFIDQIVENAQGALAPYSIDIVTSRPSAGDYYMSVLGGDPVMIHGGTSDEQILNDFACVVFDRNNVDLIFDHGTTGIFTPTQYASDLLSNVGIKAGLGLVDANDDCECHIRYDACTWSAELCTFGSNAPTSTQILNGGAVNCGHTPTQNEPALLAAALGCR